jgi:hypothetical protein
MPKGGKGGDTVIKKRQAIAVLGVVVGVLLIGATFNVVAVAHDWTEWKEELLKEILIWFYNKVNNLESRIETLESQAIPQGFVAAPAYDSGWVAISQSETLTLTHNLDTTELFVYVIGKDAITDGFFIPSGGINQIYYGTGTDSGNGYRGLCWLNLDDTTIQVFRAHSDLKFDEVRVMLWKIQELPT